MHAAINQRMENVVADFVQRVGVYAESLHEDVERLVKEHKNELGDEMDKSERTLNNMQTAHTFGKYLLDFGKSHELVAMSKDVYDRLVTFEKRPKVEPPGWRQPRLHPAEEIDPDDLAAIFGKLTFEGCVVRCVLVKSSTAQRETDEKACALCDVALSDNNDIFLVDRDNRQIKVYDKQLKFKVSLGDNSIKSPNRIVCLKSKKVLIKDDKALKLLDMNGKYITSFAPSLQQPVGLAQNSDGEVLITEWMSGCVQIYSEPGKHLRQFMCASEAPGYICVTRSGHIAVTDWKQHVLNVFSKEGNLLHQYGGYGSGDNQLDHPYGVCADRYGHIIVADTWNNRVHLLTEEAHLVKTLLSKEDGIQWPQTVVITGDGLLLVVEQHGNLKLYQYMA